jgi:adenylate kinase family enzyme
MLGEQWKLPVIHADREFWQPGWTDPENDVYRSKIERLTAFDTWVFDGIPGRVPDIVLPRADTIVWIEQPAWLCAARSYLRMLMHIGRTRPDLAEGCPERFSFQLWRYAKTFNSAARPRIESWIAQYAANAAVLCLKGDKAIADFVTGKRGVRAAG